MSFSTRLHECKVFSIPGYPFISFSFTPTARKKGGNVLIPRLAEPAPRKPPPIRRIVPEVQMEPFVKRFEMSVALEGNEPWYDPHDLNLASLPEQYEAIGLAPNRQRVGPKDDPLPKYNAPLGQGLRPHRPIDMSGVIGNLNA
jgi:hypothetical protein